MVHPLNYLQSVLEYCRTKTTSRDAWISSTGAHSRHALGYIYEESPPSIAKIPAEILLLVFEQGHEGRFTSFSDNVSSVCRYWRTLAVGTPSLWSPIVFDGNGHLDYLDRARCYLERSKSFPVDIFVNCGMGNLVENLWSDLAPHLHHCRSLSIEGDGGSFYADVERLGAINTPLLQSLELTNTFPHLDTILGTWSLPPTQPLFIASNLHTIRMDMVQPHGMDATRHFFLENVTIFWFRWELPTEGHLNGDLEKATIDTQVSNIIEAMPKLCELTLTCWGTTNDASLVPLLDKLPSSLVSLELNGISVAWDLKYGDWQGRDFSRLRAIKFSFNDAVNPDDTDLFPLLEMMPSLKELYVGVVELRSRSGDSVRPVLLPHLERLTLDWVGKHTLDVFLHKLAAPELIKATIIVPVEFNPGVGNCGSEIDIPALWRSCPLVESLTLSRGCTLTRNGDLVTALLGCLRNVKSLDLRGPSDWNNGLLRGLSIAPWPCPSLEAIFFSYMPDLTQETLELFLWARKRGSLAGECVAITRLGIRGCFRLRATEALEEVGCDVWQ